MPLTARDVESALLRWTEADGASARLINHSENHTFLIETLAGAQYALRIHRDGYQSRAAVESELAWLAALHRDTTLPIPEPLPGRDGRLLQHFETPAGERLAVLFRHIEGHEPQPDDPLEGVFSTLGRYAATLHRHVLGWQRPEGFERQVWNAANILDADGLWGDWRVAPGVDAGSRPILDQLSTALRERLAAYGTGPDRYGLIHADMRLGNLLVHGDTIALIDFDDSGFCWFAYDFAAAISFHETHAVVPRLKAAWLEGYQGVRPLAQRDIEMIDTMVMLRRMALLAWVGSHAETRLAQQHMPGFARGTVHLAERYLRGPIWA